MQDVPRAGRVDGAGYKELGASIKELSPEELLELANRRRAELEATGEIDRVADDQPAEPPARDNSFVGSWLEICWLGALLAHTHHTEEIAKGDKRKKIQEKIWCEGEVVLVANGTTTTENPENAKCKKLAKAGAVRVKWPAGPARQRARSQRALCGSSFRMTTSHHPRIVTWHGA